MSNPEISILYGAPLPPTYMQGSKSLGEFCLSKLQELSNSVVIVDALTSVELTGLQFRARTIHVAECLHAAGINNGNCVGISSENRQEFADILFAIIYVGATAAPFNITYTENEINHVLNLSKPKIVFCSPITIEKVGKIAKQHSSIEQIIVFADNSNNSDVLTYTNFVNNPNVKHDGDFKCSPVDMFNNIALILMSSGTTGLPKGVQLTQSNLVIGFFQHFNRPRRNETDLVPKEIILGIMPWFHAYGCTTLIGRILYNSQTVFLPKYEKHSFLKSIETFKINTLYIVPPIMIFLAKHPLVDKHDLSSVKVIICGAAPLTKSLEEDVKHRLNVPIIRQGYGMTEGTLTLIFQDDNHHKQGSVGLLAIGLQGKVVDVITRKSLGPYKKGEILVKGGVVMKGYISNSVETKNIIDADGWLNTGDIGYYDKDEEWFIVDRLKELIKYKTYQVAPAELEALLLQHPKVKEAGVVGLPDDECGEKPIAFVVKRIGMECTTKEITDFVAAKVSPPKRLRGGVVFVKKIPKNASGKILRKVLRNMLQENKSKL